MDPKEGKPSGDETTVSPTAEDPETPGSSVSTEEETKGTAGMKAKEGPPEGAETQEKAPAEDGISAEFHGEADGLPEVKVEVESQKENGGKEAQSELVKEDDGKEESTAASQEMTGRKEETEPESKEAKENEQAAVVSQKQKADENEAKPQSMEKADVNDRDKREHTKAVGEEATDKGAKPESQKQDDVKDEAKAEPPEADGKEDTESDVKELEPGGPTEEQEEDTEKESEEGAVATPSSPEEWPESPTEEGHSLSPDGVGPDSTASGETSPSASESSPGDVSQSPTEGPPSEEKKKERAPERRVSAPVRPRGPRAQNRKAIMDKFGGAASGPTALFRNTKAAGAAIGGVKNMLLEWCRAMTRNYEHVDIQNFSSSWSSGMAFCALIHKFFPDAFDYAALDPTKRRHNFTLAFSTAEKLADCAQLLEVDDMVRLAVPDSKCVYTYIQELYRSLVQKGLVKTKKK
ncbi:smoothelin-like protein 1 isoform X2 [Perognathus longimembris pacificus]|uniref:smoothelin-like protein 1 isoform X2 n=1 Tax=Perognathus longimembris pacificus TaxID=214514 RepID=UPI0020193E95|nr:smoothelin-like protein 1 isoform X2 [Perognathus longimembris pacificus]